MHAARRAFHDAQMGWKTKSGDPIWRVIGFCQAVPRREPGHLVHGFLV